MEKIKLAPRPYMYPKPAVLTGAMVKDQPNFMTIANCGIIGYDPALLYVAAARGHFTNQGIRRNRTFSVNVPSVRLAALVDFCGLHSGRRTDKSKYFEIFFGELGTAPLIRECPVNFECRLVRTLHWADEEVFIGEIVALHIDKKCFTAGKPDIKKIDPLIYSTSDRAYFRLGEKIAAAYSAGKTIRRVAPPRYP